MSYQGFVPMMSSYLETVLDARKPHESSPVVSILEIGVDRGQTTLVLMNNLIYKNIPFQYTAVDIRHDSCLSQQVTLFEGVDHRFLLDQSSYDSAFDYHQGNSLEFLENTSNVYDLVLIDGDHNYSTVSRELGFLDKITHHGSLVLCDDYAGRHESKDSFYQEYDTHKNLEHLTKDLDTTKNLGGVKGAVDEFLDKNDKWVGKQMGETEVCVLARGLRFSAEVLEKIKGPSGKFMFHPENFKCTWNIKF